MWYDAVSYLLSYTDDPSVTVMVGDAVGTRIILLSFLVPLEQHCPAISVGSRHSRVLKAPEIDEESWSIGAPKVARWSGDPGALESLESLKLSAKFADDVVKIGRFYRLIGTSIRSSVVCNLRADKVIEASGLS